MSYKRQKGLVVFVGAGPGAPDLVTLRGYRTIAEADIIIWASSLVAPEIIADHRPDAQIIDSANIPLEDLIPLYTKARDEKLLVARVHTGDPNIYGATAEQRDLCNQIGIDFETIPGISAFSAAAARMDVEITLPEVAQSLIITRLEGGRTPMPSGETIRSFAAHGTTMAIYLSAMRAQKLQDELLAGGYKAETPVIIGYRVSWPDERIWRVELAELASTMKENELTKHTLVMVGPALASGQPVKRSHLYHPGFAHEYRPATAVDKAKLEQQGALAVQLDEDNK